MARATARVAETLATARVVALATATAILTTAVVPKRDVLRISAAAEAPLAATEVIDLVTDTDSTSDEIMDTSSDESTDKLNKQCLKRRKFEK